MVEIQLNGEKHVLAEPRSVAQLIESLDLTQRRVAVIRNGDVIHREEYAATVLTHGDTVDVVHMVGGG